METACTRPFSSPCHMTEGVTNECVLLYKAKLRRNDAESSGSLLLIDYTSFENQTFYFVAVVVVLYTSCVLFRDSILLLKKEKEGGG